MGFARFLKNTRKTGALATFVLLTSLCLYGATSAAWETASYADYLKGRLSGVSLTPDGVLLPGPPLLWEASLGQPALWSIATLPDGTTYAATGHGGRLFRISSDGQSTSVWNSGFAELFAVVADSAGNLWIGSSPNGGLYRLNPASQNPPVEVWHSPDKYIWAIQPAPDGSFYVATGESGRIYRVDAAGKAAVVYETGQGSVTALALKSDKTLYAGTEPNGLVYEISPSGKATVLYDSPLPEIRSIALDASSGAIYVAAMGGAVSTRNANASSAATASASATVTASTPTVITVTEAAEKARDEQSGTRIADASRSTATASQPTATAASTSTVTEVSGADKSAIYRIAADRTVDTLRTSKDENIYDLIWKDNALWFSTDNEGRIYRWQDGKAALVAELGTGETTRLLSRPNGLLAAVSNPARVVLLGSNLSGAAGKNTSYESQVHDSGSVARWGHILQRPAGSNVRFFTRTGNAVRPDATWSAWSLAAGDENHLAIVSPIARYIQWRAEWPEGKSTALNSVSLSYLAQNAAPVVRSVSVTSVLGANAAKNAATAANSTAAYSITVTDSGDASSAATSATAGPNQTVSRLQSTQTQVSWQADDPDGDKLVYSLSFRAEDAHEWQLLRSRMYENTLLLDPDIFADGRYVFKVTASDAPSNAESYAKRTDYLSASVLVDNTPPVVSVENVSRHGMEADLTVKAADQTSPLKRAEYSLDAGWWQPLEAVDGITDTPREEFQVHIDKLKPGEHLVVFRVYDAAGNAGLTKVLLR